MDMLTGPCDWPIVQADTCEDLDALDYGVADAVMDAARGYLWRWTGRVFGLCTRTVRPCSIDCDKVGTYWGWAGHPDTQAPGAGTAFRPRIVDGEFINLTCGRCGDRCSCDQVSEVRLPGPVHSITEVTIDGEVLDPGAYRVDEWSRLIRDDGEAWPRCQNLGSPAGETGTWTVTYQFGVEVPPGGRIAAGELACQMAKSLRRARDCRLPERVQTVTREGVTIAVVDAFEGLDQGQTGLWVVDSWVASVIGPPARSSVHAPGHRPSPARTTFRGSP